MLLQHITGERYRDREMEREELKMRENNVMSTEQSIACINHVKNYWQSKWRVEALKLGQKQ